MDRKTSCVRTVCMGVCADVVRILRCFVFVLCLCAHGGVLGLVPISGWGKTTVVCVFLILSFHPRVEITQEHGRVYFSLFYFILLFTFKLK